MATLQDFNSSAPASLDDFQVEEPRGSIANEKTKNNIAGNFALLSDQPVETYQQVHSDLTFGNTTETGQRLQQDLEEKNKEAERQYAYKYLADPTVSDEDKRAMADWMAESWQSTEILNEIQVMSEEALVAGDGVNTADGLATRDEVSRIFHEANQYYLFRQNILNKQALFDGQDSEEIIWSIGELIFPFVEQDVISQMDEAVSAELGIDDQNDLGGVALGNFKATLFEKFQAMPIHTRMEIGQRIVDVVKNNTSAVLDENTLRSIDLIDKMLQDGSYTDAEYWFDTVVGGLDILLVGGVIRSLAKGRRFIRRNPDAPQIPEGRLPTKLADEAITRAVDAGQQAEKTVETTLRTKKPKVKLKPEAYRLWLETQTKKVKSDVVPTSPAETLPRVNTGKARQMHEAALADATDQVSQVYSGTSRAEYNADVNAVQIRNQTTGGVDVKLANPNDFHDTNISQPFSRGVRTMDDEQGRLFYYPAEKELENARVKNDFLTQTDIFPRVNMSDFIERSDGLDASVTYGRKDSGFSDPQAAIAEVKYSLRQRGVDDRNITLLKRGPAGYSPVDNATTEAGDYLVRVDQGFRFSATRGEVGKTKKGKTKADKGSMVEAGQMEDTFSGGLWGAFKSTEVARYILAPEAIIEPRLMKAAFSAVDQGAGIQRQLVEQFNIFRKQFKGLDKPQQQNLQDAIVHANLNSVAYDTAWRAQFGLNDDAYEAALTFKRAQDNVYWLENDDALNTLRNQGYARYRNGDTDLIAKPLPRNMVDNKLWVIDPNTGQSYKITDAQLKALYQNNGTLAQLRTPIDDNGRLIEHIVSQERVDQGYLRSLTPEDQVLNYRPGYFKVAYKDPIYLIQKVTDKDGKTMTRAYKTSESVTDAEVEVAAAMRNAPAGTEYFWRHDLKKMGLSDEDASFDMNNVGGRSPQRLRGQRLESASGSAGRNVGGNVKDFEDAFKASVMSIANRTSTRQYVEAFKNRMMTEFKDLMPVRDGQRVWPGDPSSIRYRDGRPADAAVYQARSMYRFLEHLEDTSNTTASGRAWKASMDKVADVLGQSFKTPQGEAVFRYIGEKDPVRFSTKVAFDMQVGTAAPAQLITQGSGILPTLMMHPGFIGRYGPQLGAIIANKYGAKLPDNFLSLAGITQKELVTMYNKAEELGIFDGADLHQIVQRSMAGVSDAQRLERAEGLYQRNVDFLRSVGFDVGERLNLMTGFMARADESRRAGKLNTAEDWERVAGEAREYTFGMNRAGEYAFQRNDLRLPMQYMQIMFKGFGLLTTNKTLKGKTKVGVAGAALMAYGYAAVPGSSTLDEWFANWEREGKPVQAETKKLVEDGVIEYLSNTLLGFAWEGTGIEVSERINPFDYAGTLERVTDLVTDFSLQKIITDSPAGMTMGKIGDAVRAGSYGISYNWNQPPEDYEEAMSFVQGIANVMLSPYTGWSNVVKADLALKYGKHISSSGAVTDKNVNPAEAVAKAFGFRTQAEAKAWDLRKTVQGESTREAPSWQGAREDIQIWYKAAKQWAMAEGEDPSSFEMQQKVMGAIGHSLFNENPMHLKILHDLMKRDLKNGDYEYVKVLAKMMGFGTDAGTLRALINDTDLDQAQKEQLHQMIDSVEELKEGK